MEASDMSIVAMAQSLEERKMYARSIEQQLKDKDISIKAAKEERRLLEELRTVNTMTVRKMESAGPERAVRAPLARDTEDRITQLDNLMKHELAAKEKLYVQKQTLQSVIDAKDQTLQVLHQKLAELKSMTSWDARTIKSKDDYVDIENRTLELRKRLSVLQEEQATVKTITTEKTKLIEELATSLEGQKELEAELFQSQTTLKVKERELEDTRDELRTLNRIAQKKNRMLDTLKADDEQKRIKQYETQKKVLQHEIAKSMETRRVNDRTILAQQSRIDSLTEKLAVIANVFRTEKGGAALTPEEHEAFRPGLEVGQEEVPVEAFDALQAEITDMRATLAEREAQLTELDGTIESIERKVNILSKAKAASSKRHVLDSRDMNLEAAQLEAYMTLRQESYETQLQQLQSENVKLKRDVQRVAKR